MKNNKKKGTLGLSRNSKKDRLSTPGQAQVLQGGRVDDE